MWLNIAISVQIVATLTLSVRRYISQPLSLVAVVVVALVAEASEAALAVVVLVAAVPVVDFN
jgi:hypothetical protein